jgi:hypothetical protein
MSLVYKIIYQKHLAAKGPNIPRSSFLLKNVLSKTKVKDRTLETKDRTLEAKDMNFSPRGFSRPRPVLADYNTDIH